MREIEIKLRVADLEALAKTLQERGCRLSAPLHQHDVIYSHRAETRPFDVASEGDIIPRIRRENGSAQFNLKQQRSGEMDNIEYETQVDDPAAMHQILILLGYQPAMEVKKIRRKGKLGDYEICLDDVDGLGTYVELEKLAPDDADPIVVRDELFKTLESLGLSRADEETKGYDTQLYFLLSKNK